MKFESFLNQIQGLPVIEVEHLLAGKRKSYADALRVQLVRWLKAGKLVQLKRGFYLLAAPYRKKPVYEFYVATILKAPSYITLEKALEFYNFIPEAVHVFTSVTPKRPGRYQNSLGTFQYRHIHPDLFWGYESLTHAQQTGFIALPEKCFLDLFYYFRGETTASYLDGLRLQNLDKLSLTKLLDFAKRFNKPKILRSAEVLSEHIHKAQKEEKTL